MITKRLFTTALATLCFCTLTEAQRLSLNLPSTTVRQAIEQLQKQGYSFIYQVGDLDTSQRVQVKATTVEQAVRQIVGSQAVTWEISGRKIIISARRDDGKPQPARHNDTKKFSGILTDDNGEPIVGAVVRSTESGTVAVTDAEGRWSIQARHGDKVEFSSIGFMPATAKLGSRTEGIAVQMSDDNRQLGEVVVVGYGTQKKVNLTGAVAVVSGKDLTDRPVANMSQLLQGAAPNVNVSINGGMPGKSGSINVRGIASISGASSPLILIDGVEGSIDDVNPYDVESISVLKDASSAAIYGARAAYGVILVTTKNGRDGKTHISYNGMFGLGGLTARHDFETRGYYSAAIIDKFFSTYQGKNYTNFNDEDYYELWIRRNDRTENPERPWVVMKNNQYKYYGNTNWFDYFFNTSRPTWQHNVTINGGNNKAQWFISGGMYSQQGINRHNTDRFKRLNYRSKLKMQVTDWMSVSNNTTYFKSSYKYPAQANAEALFRSVMLHGLAAYTPRNPDGTATYLTHLVDGYAVINGIPSVIEYGKHRNDDAHDNFQTTFEGVLTPLRHFTLTANYTYYFQQYTNFNRSVRIPYSKEPGVVEYRSDIYDELFERAQNSYYHGYNIFGAYENTFNKAHHVTLTGGTNYETLYLKSNSEKRNDLLSEELSDFNLAKGEQMVITGGKRRYALLGFFYRANYDYKSRYLFEASGRYDGSSRFQRTHRWGFFPSFSAGWRISEEPFFATLRKTVDNLKLRLSYGSLGNQQVGYYDYVQVINSGSEIGYSFGGEKKISGASVSDPNASDLTWEKVYTCNAGVDVSLLGSRLSLTADVYIRDTHDMLMPGKELPYVYGAASPRQNAANLRTKGYELSLSWNDKVNLYGSPLSYGVTLGFADSKTKITKYDNPDKSVGNYYEGLELGSIWGFKADGFFKTDEEARNYAVDQSYLNSMINISVIDNGLHAGDVKFVDLDGDGKILPSLSAKKLRDQRIIGNSLPRWTYNGKVDLSWKGIGISALWQGVVRQHWYPGSETYLFWGPYSRPYQTFIPSDFLSKVWSESNTDSYFPRPRGYVALNGAGGSRELTRPNTMYLQNAGYLRLKNLTVSYNLPRTWLKAVHLESVRVYFSGENLFTLSGLDSKYIDPEACGAGYSPYYNSGHRNVNGYPMQKTYSFGLNITL